MIPVMIDSGAYSAYNKKTSIDLEKYIAFCLELVQQSPDVVVVNLDVINNGAASYQNWVTMRKAGLNPLPVYHVVTDIRWLRKYLHHTDYVGIGAIANLSSNKRTWALDRIWEDYLVDSDGMPKVRIHGMGITSFPLMLRYPWFSVDSTSFLQAAMYGKLFVPHLRDGQWIYDRKPYTIGVSTKSPSMKEKGNHITTVTPHLRKILERFVADSGYTIGKSTLVDGEEVVEEAGVTNTYNVRCDVNALFFARFAQSLRWPRPFNIRRPKGLWQ